MTLATTEQRNGTSALAVRDNPMGIAMETYNSPQVIAVIRDQICPDATAPEMWQFLARCVALGLDPFSRQMYFIKRQGKVSHQIGIDGFRSIADKTGELIGISEPEYEGSVDLGSGKMAPEIARVRIIREINGKDREFVGVARWHEFVPAHPNDFMWKKMPYHMLGKCGEAQAMRRAFPQKMGGLQTDAEALGAEEIFAATVQNRGRALEPQYIEVTNPNTGEMKQVRAGDEYVRMMGEQGEDVQKDPAPVARSQPPRTDYSEGNATARRASESLSQIIDQPSDSPPEPPDDDDRMVAAAAEQDDAHAQASGQADGSDSSTSNEAAEAEPAELGPNDYDYGLCKEIFEAHPELTLDKVLPKLKPADYAAWHSKYVKALEAANGLPF